MHAHLMVFENEERFGKDKHEAQGCIGEEEVPVAKPGGDWSLDKLEQAEAIEHHAAHSQHWQTHV